MPPLCSPHCTCPSEMWKTQKRVCSSGGPPWQQTTPTRITRTRTRTTRTTTTTTTTGCRVAHFFGETTRSSPVFFQKFWVVEQMAGNPIMWSNRKYEWIYVDSWAKISWRNWGNMRKRDSENSGVHISTTSSFLKCSSVWCHSIRRIIIHVTILKILLEMMSLRQESSFGKKSPHRNHLLMSFWSPPWPQLLPLSAIRSLKPTPVKYCKASASIGAFVASETKTKTWQSTPTWSLQTIFIAH